MPAPFDPICLFETLSAHGVEYVVIGGMAAVIHGSPMATVEADVVPSTDPDNLARLAEALEDLAARIRTPDDPAGVAFDPHPTLLATMKMVNLTTRCGDLNLTFEPAALGGFDDIVPITVDLDTVEVSVATLDDVIRSKRAADRPKDRAVLPVLEALRDELDRNHT